MTTVIYNCKKCKVGRRVEYPIAKPNGWFARQDETGKIISMYGWIQAYGGGKPPEYGGDPLALCPKCGKLMSFGQLKAVTAPEHVCDARCINARGHNCECSCGGANHGKAWQT